MFSQYYPFYQLKLQYNYDSLEPNIGEATMYFHYNELYLPALEKLNELVKSVPLWQNIPLEYLTKNSDKDLQRLSGTVYNHELYFSSLTDKKTSPSKTLQTKIDAEYGSTEKLFEAIRKTAEEVFGTGYVYLAIDKYNNMLTLVTGKQKTPDFEEYYPLYTIDLWEHAYYIDKIADRNAYVESALAQINWEEIEDNLDAFRNIKVILSNE